MQKKFKMIDVGVVFDTKITFQIKDNGDGITDLDAYSDYIKVSAETMYGKSRLMSQANSENTKRYRSFKIRYRKDLTETMRVINKGEPWEIESILPINNEKLYLLIDCYQIKNDLSDDYKF